MKTKRILFNVAFIVLLFVCIESLVFLCSALPGSANSAYPGPGDDTWTPRPTATATPTRTPKPTWVTPMPIYYELTVTTIWLSRTPTPRQVYPVPAFTDVPRFNLYAPVVVN